MPWMEEAGRLQSMGSLRVRTTEQLHFHFSLSCIGEGNGTPLQCSCLENPREGGAWWAAVYGVAQSRTRLTWLSSSSSSSWGGANHPPLWCFQIVVLEKTLGSPLCSGDGANPPTLWFFWIVVLEKTLGSPLKSKEIKPANPKGNQSWIFIGRTDAEAPILWPPDLKNWLIEKDPDSGKDWRREEKGMTEDEMTGWHHRLNGHESE